MSTTNNGYAKELLTLEYEYLTELLISNEEMGEKRVGIFVGLTAGLGAAAVVVREQLDGSSGPTFAEVFLAVGIAWLLFGYLTFVRVICRNITTDDLKVKLNIVRSWFVDRSDLKALCHMPWDPFEAVKGRSGLRFRGKGGYAELVALINSVLAGAVAWQAAHDLVGALPVLNDGQGTFVNALAIAIASIVALVAWKWHVREAANLYKPKKH